MSDIEGHWLAATPFGPIELIVDEAGGFDLGGQAGALERAGGALRIAGTDVHLPPPTDGAWWVPLPDSTGVLRFVRKPSDGERLLGFDSGLQLKIPSTWVVGEVPGAVSAHPPEAARPGLPPAAFVEVYESLAPVEDEVLTAAMIGMLRDRTGSKISQPAEHLDVGGRSVLRFSSLAQAPTGERIRVRLWVTTQGDHVLAVAQAWGDGDSLVPDTTVRRMLQSATFPPWERDHALQGRWERTERRPSGPLTEIVERSLTLDSDGSYHRLRSSLLEVPEGSRPPERQPRERRERIGLWYTQPGKLLLSAGLQGYRVTSAEIDGGRLILDGEEWTPSQSET